MRSSSAAMSASRPRVSINQVWDFYRVNASRPLTARRTGSLRHSLLDMCTNSTYINAIGTVGNVHIGLYTRLLWMFIADPSTKPSTTWMRMWVDWTRMWKWRATGAALEFFTYSELIIWIVPSLIFNPWRWQWIPLVLFDGGRIRSVQSGWYTAEVKQEHHKASNKTEENRESEKTSKDVDDSEPPTSATALGSRVSVTFHNKPLRAKASSSASSVAPTEQSNGMAGNVKVKTVPRWAY